MASRLELHEELVKILGSRNVYYQPPESLKLRYPAIVYSRSDIRNVFADNDVYSQSHHYEVVVIDSNPDSEIVEKMSKFKTSRFQRHYTFENLNHDVFNVYY